MSFDNVDGRGIRSRSVHPGNPRVHSKKQIKQITEGIRRFGFTCPVLITSAGKIIAGRGRQEPAKLLGTKTVPMMVISDLSPAELRAHFLANINIAPKKGRS